MVTIDVFPKSIKNSGFCGSKWRNSETECAAAHLLEFAKSRDNWGDFTKKEIDEFAKHDFQFGRLTTMGDILQTIKESPTIIDCEPYKRDEYPYGIATQKIKWKVTSHIYSFTDSFINECLNYHKKS